MATILESTAQRKHNVLGKEEKEIENNFFHHYGDNP